MAEWLMTKVKGYPFEIRLGGKPVSVALARLISVRRARKAEIEHYESQ